MAIGSLGIGNSDGYRRKGRRSSAIISLVELNPVVKCLEAEAKVENISL